MSLPWILIQYGPDGAGIAPNGTISGPPPWVLISYGTDGSAVTPADVTDPSLGPRGGGASRKQLKKYLQNEERFQRRKRELDRVFETMGQPKKVASLKNTADIGGPKLIIIPDIDDDDDDLDIMIWAAQ